MPTFTLKRLMILVAVVAVTVFICTNITLDPLAPVTNLQSFERLRNEFPDCLASHFPRETPSGAKLFYYTPGPLQATAAMQLLVEVEPSRLEDLRETFAAQAIDSFRQFDPALPFSQGVKTGNGYPQRVYTANGIDYFGSNDDHYYVLFEGNGGEPAQSGVVINDKRKTILYYCDVGKSTNLNK